MGIYRAEGIIGIAVLDYVFTGMWDFSGSDAGWNAVSSYVEKAVEEKAAGDPAGQFKDAILAVASGLNAGYSVEKCVCGELKGDGGDPWE